MDLAVFFAGVRPIFGGALTQQQVDGLGLILEAWARYGDGDQRKLAYILATAFHETGATMQALKETGNASNPLPSDAKVKERLTKAWKAGKLPWVETDYWSGGWFGRGLVQLTHRENYVKMSKSLGIDLVTNPNNALDPETSAAVLVKGMMDGTFTGKKLADFPFNFVSSRRVVNGQDRAVKIAGYAYQFLEAIKAATPLSAIPANPTPEPVTPTTPDRTGIGWVIAAVVGAILTGLVMIGAGAWHAIVSIIDWMF